ncbi:MAG: diphosphomevalonate decarboxylase [Polyangiaceae bacterium]
MSGREATAVAHPNIALSKYWGKRVGNGNFPAVPSLSLTLAGIATRTRVSFERATGDDALILNGAAAIGEPLARVTALLDRVRAASGISTGALVETTNDFPTASGLASSASGFAALALAATRAAGVDWEAAKVSDLARRSSASAARSVFGGVVELGAGPLAPTDADFLSATPLIPPDAVDLAVVVCVTTEGAKAHGSTDAMRATAERSPYYATWLEVAPRIHAALKEALVGGDFARAGALAEESALAMHASAFAAGFTYFRDATLAAMGAVRALRAAGTPAFFTMDAGPHVKVFVKAKDADAVSQRLSAAVGTLRTIVCRPGPAAYVEAGGR